MYGHTQRITMTQQSKKTFCLSSNIAMYVYILEKTNLIKKFKELLSYPFIRIKDAVPGINGIQVASFVTLRTRIVKILLLGMVRRIDDG